MDQRSGDGQETLSDIEDFSSGHRQVLGNSESLIRKILQSRSSRNTRDYMLAEAE